MTDVQTIIEMLGKTKCDFEKKTIKFASSGGVIMITTDTGIEFNFNLDEGFEYVSKSNS